MSSYTGGYRDGFRAGAASRDPEIAEIEKQNEELRQQLEIERMRIVACDVVAMSDTPSSAEEARKMLPEYRSAALESVIRRVDECIALRQQLAEAQVFEALWAGACEVAKNDPVQAIYRLREQVTLLWEALKQARHMIYYDEPQIGWNITRIDEVLAVTEPKQLDDSGITAEVFRPEQMQQEYRGPYVAKEQGR